MHGARLYANNWPMYERVAFERAERAIGWGTATVLNSWKDRENWHLFPSKRNSQQTRYVFEMAKSVRLMTLDI